MSCHHVPRVGVGEESSGAGSWRARWEVLCRAAALCHPLPGMCPGTAWGAQAMCRMPGSAWRTVAVGGHRMPGSAQRCQLGCGERGAGLGVPAPCEPGLSAGPWAVLATVGAHPVPPPGRSTTTCGASSARSTRTTASLTSLSASGTGLTGEHAAVRLRSAQGCLPWCGPRGPLAPGQPLPWPLAGCGVWTGAAGTTYTCSLYAVGMSEGPTLSRAESVTPLCVTQGWKKVAVGLASDCQNLGIMSLQVSLTPSQVAGSMRAPGRAAMVFV